MAGFTYPMSRSMNSNWTKIKLEKSARKFETSKFKK